MTRVDFYLLQSSDANEKHRLICRLVEKAYRLGHGTYVYTDSAAAAERLDELLWVYQPGSFVPHRIYRGDDAALDTAIAIGDCPPPDSAHEVLVSLAPEVPNFFSRFERVIEFVGNDDAEKVQSRERFRFYRDRGYVLQTHTI